MRPMDKWDHLANAIVDAVSEGADEEIVAEVIRKAVGATKPAPIDRPVPGAVYKGPLDDFMKLGKKVRRG